MVDPVSVVRQVATGIAERVRGKLSGEHPYHLAALGMLIALGVGMRAAFLTSTMGYDETYSFFTFASRSLSTALSAYNINNHPLHTLLVHISTRLFGTATWAVRLPAFLAGVLLIPAAYLVMRRLFNRSVGLLTAALVAASPLLIKYSTTARGYSLVALFYMLTVLVACSLLRGGARKRQWALFVGLGVLGFYTMPTMLYFYGGIIAWMLLSVPARDVKTPLAPFLKRLTAALACTGLLTALLFMPVIVKNGLGELAFNVFTRPFPWEAFLEFFPYSMRNTWRLWTRDVPGAVQVILAVGFLLSIVFHRRVAKYRVNLALVTAAWVLLVILFQRNDPYARILLPLLPVFLGYSCAGLYYAGSRAFAALAEERRRSPLVQLVFGAAAAGLAAILCLVIIASQAFWKLDELGARDISMGPDVERITGYLSGNLKEGDIVVTDDYNKMLFTYYFMREGIPQQHLYNNALAEGRFDQDRVRRLLLVLDKMNRNYGLAVNAGDLELNDGYAGRAVFEGKDAYVLEIPVSGR